MHIGSNIKVLEPAEHHLPFRFTFPSTGLPSSFESTFGYIRYWVRKFLEPKSKLSNFKTA